MPAATLAWDDLNIAVSLATIAAERRVEQLKGCERVDLDALDDAEADAAAVVRVRDFLIGVPLNDRITSTS